VVHVEGRNGFKQFECQRVLLSEAAREAEQRSGMQTERYVSRAAGLERSATTGRAATTTARGGEHCRKGVSEERRDAD